MKNFRRHIAMSFLGVFLAGFLAMGLLAAPQRAQAQAPVAVTFSVSNVLKTILDFLYDSIVLAAQRALMNATQLVVQQAAYDIAVWVASGGEAQGPLINTLSGEEWTKGLGGVFLGEAIGDLNRDLGKTFNICEPSSPQGRLTIKLLAIDAQKPREPRCNIRNVVDNWQNFVKDIQNNPQQFLNNFQLHFEPTNNDIGAILSVNDQIFADANVKLQGKLLDRGVKSGDYTDYKGLISKRIQTPRSQVKDQVERKFAAKDNKTRDEALATYITGAIRPKTYGAAIAASFTSTLVNTFLSELTKKITTGIFKLGDLIPGGPGGQFQQGQVYGGRDAAEDAFSDLRKPRIAVKADVNYVAEFTACPEGFENVNNCTMDDDFATAVNAISTTGDGMTIQEAMDAGLLHRDWQIIPRDDRATNADNTCYSRAYCYDNLVKLRRARMISVGWEMAAEVCNTQDNTGVCSIQNPPTLNDVVKNFNNCGSPAIPGVLNSGQAPHPFCHLIDPNWVLKAPEAQCLAEVYGPNVESPELASRSSVCSDDVTCIKENENGQCEAFGYCTREKNIWRFDGEQCSAQFDSCRSYTDPDGTTLTVLDQTIDPGVCNDDNAGCLWYSTAKVDSAGTLVWSGGEFDRIFFNKKIKTCSSGDAGCTEFIRTTRGLGTNLLLNSSFEQNSDFETNIPDNWTSLGAGYDYNSDSSYSFSGASALRPGSAGIAQSITINPRSSYIFSSYITNENAVSGGKALVTAELRQGGSVRRTVTQEFDLGAGTTYSRYNFKINVTESDVDNVLLTIKESGSGSLWFDDLMIEEVFAPTLNPSTYADYGNANLAYLKKAPDYLNCYQDFSTFTTQGACDGAGGLWQGGGVCNAPAECAPYAPWCSADEVGCDEYTPEQGEQVKVTGIPLNDDYCPSECQGYSSFKQEGTDFEDEKFPVFFIPTTAQQCTLEAAGCDEFTNLDAVSNGSGQSEAREYYSQLRRCIKEGGTCQTFYTWEGQDTAGFQLKVFRLEGQQISGNTYEPKITGTTPDTCNEQQFKSQLFPDCRQFYFVDQQGNTTISYHTLSRTTVCSNECRPLRRTLTQTQKECEDFGGTWENNSQCIFNALPSASRQCAPAAAGCREYKGNSGNNVRIAFMDDFETQANGGWNGGANSNVSTNIFGNSLVNQSNATVTKNITANINQGNSYILTFWARSQSSAGGTLTPQYAITIPSQPNPTVQTFGSSVQVTQDWQQFTVGPVTIIPRESTASISQIDLSMAGFGRNQLYLDNIELKEVLDSVYVIKDSWTTPVSCDNTNITPFGALGQNNPTRDAPQAQLNCRAYRDKDGVRHFLKSFSKLCRPGAVGCEALIDTENSESPNTQVFNLRCDTATDTYDSSSRTCTPNSEPRVSCTVPAGLNYCYIDYTLPLASGPFGGPIILAQEGQQVVQQDSIRYIVNDEQYRCSDSQMGCEEVALPRLNADGDVDTTVDLEDRWNVMYLLNQPEAYQEILCKRDELFCEEFTGDNQSKRYFKHPKNRLCAYEDSKNVGGVIKKGWFKLNPNGETTDDPCYPDSSAFANVNNEIIGGVDVAGAQDHYIARVTSPTYDGWVGVCPQEQNMCTLFVDPAGSSQAGGNSRYYFLKNDNIDSASCNGQVSLSKGCVLFNDTSIPDVQYHAQYSYLLSERNNNDSVNPQACPPAQQGIDPNTGQGVIFDQCKDFDKDLNSQQVVGGTGLPVHPSNSNVVLKVRQDRVCGEWLACQTKTFSLENGEAVDLCNNLVACNLHDPSIAPSQCASMYESNRALLGVEQYQRRGGSDFTTKQDRVLWSDRDYSGYTIPGRFPIEYYEAIEFNYDKSLQAKADGYDDARLFYDTGNNGNYVCEQTSDCAEVQVYNDDGQQVPRQPECINNKCVLNIDGTEVGTRNNGALVDSASLNAFSPEISCRAYPERESPYSNDVLADNDVRTSFREARMCEENSGCSEENGCVYKKVSFGNGAVNKYYGVNDNNIPDGVCVGGPIEGTPCDPTQPSVVDEPVQGSTTGETKRTVKQCGIDSGGSDKGDPDDVGYCRKPDQQRFDLLGWQGYCLERAGSKFVTARGINEDDYKAQCLTWMPVRQLAGAANIFNNYQSAGFDQEISYYCAETTLVKDVVATGLRCASDSDFIAACDATTPTSSCWSDMYCPEGYFILMDACNTWGKGATKVGTQQEQSEGWCHSVRQEGDSCPYMCIPMGSQHTEFGESAPAQYTGKASEWKLDCWEHAKAAAGTGNFGSGGPSDFASFEGLRTNNEKVKRPWAKVSSASVVRDQANLQAPHPTYFSDCMIEGVPLSPTSVSNTGLSDKERVTVGQAEENLKKYALAYGDLRLACTEIVKTQVGTGNNAENKAWTNRLATFNRAAFSDDRAKIGWVVGEGDTYPLNYDIKEATPNVFAKVPLKETSLNKIHYSTTCAQTGKLNTRQSVTANGLLPWTTFYVPAYKLESSNVGGLVKYTFSETCDTPTDQAEPYNKITTQVTHRAYNSTGYELNSPYASNLKPEDLFKSVGTKPASCKHDRDCNATGDFCDYNPQGSGNNGVCSNDPGKSCSAPQDCDGYVQEYYCDTYNSADPNNKYCGHKVTGKSGVNLVDPPRSCNGDSQCRPSSLAIQQPTCNFPSQPVGTQPVCNKARTPCKYDNDCHVSCVDNLCTGLLNYNYEPTVTLIKETNIEEQAYARLSRLFARVYDVFRWVKGTNEAYEYQKATAPTGAALTNSKEYWDIALQSRSGIDATSNPIVAAPTPVLGPNSTFEANDSFTVNGSAAPEIEVVEGSAVLVNFYGWADKNRMPIRRVAVKWGERNGVPIITPSSSSARDGKYKNFRAVCDIERDGFGGSSEACQEGLFKYQHIYIPRDTSGNFDCEAAGGLTPGEGVLASLPRTRIPDSPALGTTPRPYCVFDPGVHILDNWGWCTGTCPGGIDGGNGCYGASIGDAPTPLGLQCSNDAINRSYINRQGPFLFGPRVILYEREKTATNP